MEARMHIIGITVTDLEAAMAFYAKLGIDFTVDPYMPGHAGCDLPNGLHVMLDTEESRAQMSTGWVKPSGSPRVFLSCEFDSPAEVDKKYAELTGAGYRGLTTPFDAPWNMRFATVLDPDGNGMDLYANQPTD